MVQSFSIAANIKQLSQQFAAFSDSAKLDAEVLLCFVLDKPRSYLFTWPEYQLNLAQQKQLNCLAEQRQLGVPIAYIVGQKEFWSLPLAVSKSTLIPRPDTEVLVETVLQHYSDQALRVLDLGTGTGAIALALASERPHWRVVAVDQSAEAVALARHNSEVLQLNDRVDVLQSNWFSALPVGQQFDLIVSNPPYIDENDPHLTQGDVRFEPRSALVSAANGLADIEEIIAASRAYLKPNGRLYFEHGFQQKEAVAALFSRHNFVDCTNITDYAGNPRVTFAQVT